MIELTPLDVRKKKEDFRKTMRGYDTQEVASFLDLVADRMEDLVREHRSLSDRVESLQEQLSHYRERERALNEALLAAQELREEARSQAERDAAVRLREAETHAEAILLEADQAIRRSQQRLTEIHAQRERFLRSLRGLLQRFADNLEVEEARLQDEPDDLGDLLHRLERESRGYRERRDDEGSERGSEGGPTGGEAGRDGAGEPAGGDAGPREPEARGPGEAQHEDEPRRPEEERREDGNGRREEEAAATPPQAEAGRDHP